MMLEASGAQLDSVIYESRVTGAQYLDRPALVQRSEWLKHHLPDNRPMRRIIRAGFNRLARLLPDVAPRTWNDFPRLERRVLEKRALPDIHACFDACDLVMISGEGCLYGNIRQSRMLLFLAYLARHGMDRETVLVNHSVDLRHPVLNEIARHVYPLLNEAVFRENDSARVCAEFCDPKVVPDAAYGFAPALGPAWLEVAGRTCYFDGWPTRVRDFDPRKPYVCVGGSSSFTRGRSRGRDPVPGYMSLCRELKQAFGQVLLVAAARQDETVLSKVADALDLPLIGIATPFPQALDIIANSLAYVGGRWHSAVFAHSGGTPVVALGAYTSKMQAFLHHIGEADVPLDPFHLDAVAGQVRERLEDIRSQGEALRRERLSLALEFRKQSRLNVHCVERQLAGARSESLTIYHQDSMP
ncbi:polysaccharide pyruvyl transferase family protein [Halomonas sp. LR5S13]|uniref:polysaccharide pyruvyl transferase family protein n=1 Tax=Halomonas rhizosphaerae TaxID=3043296 RepID=UPI0024A901A5|nr:polysaccharide pyruvyl transferase family protein [Halomonas rhizosphaerae]MDI5920863.1 polysaccharide pyruvyl transferase family protein [Halomonas rhizosphaerae]